MSNLRRILRILVFLVFIIFLTGCERSSPSNFSTTTLSPRSANIPRASCQPPSLDNCYTEGQMGDYLVTVAIPDVSRFSQYNYSHMPLPNFVYIPEGQIFDSVCGQVNEDAYEFCSTDDTVYIGQKSEWKFYSEYGSVSPVFGVAHEFGHHIQFEAGVPDPTSSQEEVNHENQADCVAGAWVFWADRVAHILEYPKDFGNIANLLVAISSAEGPEKTHGTVAERALSFEIGYISGLSACNSYYPNHPILTQNS